jgi:hypothetical protein
MAALTGTAVRSLFPFRGKPFVQWVYEALRVVPAVHRIAIVGPESLSERAGLSAADLLVPERDSYTANLFAGIEALAPSGRVLVTASDNPLLSAAAFQDFLDRAPQDAGLVYPVLPHGRFLERFPHAKNVAIKLRDGRWIGGDCVLIHADAVEPLRTAIHSMADARKSLVKVVRLLGPGFALRFVTRRVTVPDVERRVTELTGVTFRTVPDCDPVFAIDIDDPVDWQYLLEWEKCS